MKNIITPIFCLLGLVLQGINSFSQSITLSGSGSSSIGSQETYTASFSYSVNPYTNFSWSVSGGTIISQEINPTASTIYCTVEWESQGEGIVSLYDDLQGISGEKSVQICGEADGGPDQIICPGDCVVIGVPAMPGATYSWSPTTGLNNPYIAQPTACPTSTTTYVVTMTSTGCPSTQTPVLVTVRPAPPTITPIGPITVYNQYESQYYLTLTASSNESYQWYKNGNPISGATNQSYAISLVGAWNNTDYYYCQSPCGNSNNVSVTYHGCMNYSEYPVTIPQNGTCLSNYPLSIVQPNLGSGASYYWDTFHNPSCYYFSDITNIYDNTALFNSNCSGPFHDEDIFTRAVATDGTEVRMRFGASQDASCRTMTMNLNEVNNGLKIQLSPNPAINQITINSPSPIHQVDLYSVSGQHLNSILAKSNLAITINLSDYHKQCILVRITTSEGIYFRKIIIV